MVPLTETQHERGREPELTDGFYDSSSRQTGREVAEAAVTEETRDKYQTHELENERDELSGRLYCSSREQQSDLGRLVRRTSVPATQCHSFDTALIASWRISVC
jgi:hypothetical protein